MKFEYEKPDLEEIELILEGSFLDSDTSKKEDGDKGGEWEEGDEWA